MNKVKVALVGANGMLASMLIECAPPSVELRLLDLPEFNITDVEQVDRALTTIKPDVIINCAAFTQVDTCETQQEIALQVNGKGPGLLAEVARNIDAILVHVSTDFVFSGATNTPYLEDDTPVPISVYGKTKLQGERAILESDLVDYYIVRTSWLYGPNGSNFVETILRLATERESLGIVADQIGTPTYTADLAMTIWELISRVTLDSSLVAAPYGIYHYSNDGECSWYDFACEIVRQLRETSVAMKVRQIKPITTAEYPMPAQRPAYSVLSKKKIISATGLKIPLWQESLERYLKRKVSQKSRII